eukprot:TRINITY_DN3101_c1_g8_i1.p1 TRINITY_DN3101_c1_g8~~TRINITY_DN3101_c1_g8_i1.p1  ORF type:complete len:810 (+),score=255.27 TRINITY_DN3101_c1_g8_i1:1085-3514(+)
MKNISQKHYHTPKLNLQTEEIIPSRTIRSARIDSNKTKRYLSDDFIERPNTVRYSNRRSPDRSSNLKNGINSVRIPNPYDIVLNQDRIQKTRRKLPTTLPDPEDMYEQIQKLKVQLGELSSSIKKKDIVIRKLESEANKKDLEIERLYNYRLTIDGSQSSIGRDKSLIRRLKDNLKKITAENIVLQDELEAMKNSQRTSVIEDLRQRLGNSLLMLERCNDMCLQYSIDMTKGNISDADQFLTQFFESFPDFQIPLHFIPSSVFDVRVVELENELLAKEEQIFVLENSNYFQEEIDRLKENEQTYENEIYRLKEVVRLKKDELDDLHQELSQTSKKFKESVFEQQKSQNRVEELQNTIELLTKENLIKRDRITHLEIQTRKFSDELKEMHKINVSQDFEMQAEDASIALMKEDAKLWKNKFNTIESLFKDVDNDKKELTKENTQLKFIIEQQETTIKELQDQVQLSHHEKESFMQQKLTVEELKKQIQLLLDERETFKKQQQRTSDAEVLLQKELKNAIDMVNLKTKDNETLKKTIEKLKRRNDDLRGSLVETSRKSGKIPKNNEHISSFSTPIEAINFDRSSMSAFSIDTSIPSPKSARNASSKRLRSQLDSVRDLLDTTSFEDIDSEQILSEAKTNEISDSIAKKRNQRRKSIVELLLKDKLIDHEEEKKSETVKENTNPVLHLESIVEEREQSLETLVENNYSSPIYSSSETPFNLDPSDEMNVQVQRTNSYVIANTVTPLYGDDEQSTITSYDDLSDSNSSKEESYLSDIIEEHFSSLNHQKSSSDEEDDDFLHKTKLSMTDFEFL